MNQKQSGVQPPKKLYVVGSKMKSNKKIIYLSENPSLAKTIKTGSKVEAPKAKQKKWTKFKKAWVSVVAVLSVIAIVCAIVLPIMLEYKQGEKSEVMFDYEAMPFDNEKYCAKTLYKDADKDFTIVNFADTQIATSLSLAKVGDIYKTISRVIDETNPDLITMSGDQAWFPVTRQCYQSIANMMDGFQIPWAIVFGNHDHQGNADLNYLGEIVANSEYGIFDKGFRNVSGVGNYYINIVEKQSNGKEKIVHTVFMMDSGDSGLSYTEEQIQTTHDYNYISDEDIKTIQINAESLKNEYFADCTMDFEDYPFLEEIEEDEAGNKYANVTTSYYGLEYSQIGWYKWVLEGLEATNIANGFVDNAMPESTCVFHIPFYEYYLAYRDFLFAIRNNDTNALKSMDVKGRMRMHETGGLTGNNIGFFDAMVEMGSTKNVICGHDHVNDFSIVYKGIRLTYGVKTGDECYWEDDGSMNGGTMIKVSGSGSSLSQVYVSAK